MQKEDRTPAILATAFCSETLNSLLPDASRGHNKHRFPDSSKTMYKFRNSLPVLSQDALWGNHTSRFVLI